MKVTILSLIILLSSTLFTAKAQEPATVAILVSSVQVLDNVVQNGLTRLDNIISDQQRTLFMNLVNYTGYLKSEMKDLTDDLTRDLSQMEQALLADVNAITRKLNDASLDWINKVEDIGTIVEASTARLPFADKTPTPSFYKMPSITNHQNKNIELDIKGVRLNNKRNYIVFSGKTIPVSSIGSDKINSYTISLTDNDVFRSDTMNTFKVVLHKKRFLAKQKKYEYNPKFIVVPNSIGNVKVHYATPFVSVERQNGLTDIVHATSGSNKTKDVKKQFNVINSASLNWRIDRTSIRCWKEKGNGDKHGYGGPYSITDISFIAKAYAKDGRAVCRCSWNEYREVNGEEVHTSEAIISFNSQQIVQVPKNSRLIKTEVEYSDSSKFQSSDSFFKNKFIEFTFKPLQNLWEAKYSP